MEPADYWRTCDELSIAQAAMLMVSETAEGVGDLERREPRLRPEAYEAAKAAISNALLRGWVTGTMRPSVEDDGVPGSRASVASQWFEHPGAIDPDRSTVMVASLKAWLSSQGISTGFFFDRPSRRGYLDRDHPRYAPKLAAAVNAWLAMEGAELGRKSPKQTLLGWLRAHADEFELSGDDGKPNETGIEEVAKVANWQPGGGAPKTPGSS